jgi:4'-phosphopantetheinyl transferase
MGTLTIREIGDLRWEKAFSAELGTNGVHIYRIRVSNDPVVLTQLGALLNSEEQERAYRYMKVQDRYRFITGRASLRQILSHYTGLSTADIQFSAGKGYKPALAGHPEICFNLSHTADWILLAISGLEVGVDLEFIQPEFRYQEVVDAHFTDAERSYLSLDGMDRRFYEIWTRKEAFLKATGQGLGDHLNLSPALAGYHELSPELDGSDLHWQLMAFNLEQDYVAAVAVATGMESPCFMDYQCPTGITV